MKCKIVYPFKDAKTKKKYELDEVVDFNESRIKEINAVEKKRSIVLIEPVIENGNPDNEKATTNVADGSKKDEK